MIYYKINKYIVKKNSLIKKKYWLIALMEKLYLVIYVK
jgi:hypothetical protein